MRSRPSTCNSTKRELLQQHGARRPKSPLRPHRCRVFHLSTLSTVGYDRRAPLLQCASPTVIHELIAAASKRRLSWPRVCRVRREQHFGGFSGPSRGDEGGASAAALVSVPSQCVIDLERGAGAFPRAAFHVALEVLRAVFAGE